MPKRLSDEIRSQILERIKYHKETFQKIADDFGVCKHTVYLLSKEHGISRSGMPRVNKHPTEITAEYLRTIIIYDPETGLFRWPKKPAARVGWSDALGYIHVRIGRSKLYLAHRLAWLYVFGEWPEGVIDHINGHTSDNRISNLRVCTQQQNCQNRKPVWDRSSIRSGVSFDKRRKKFRAYITIGRKQMYLGRFGTAEEATEARKNAELKLFGEFARQEAPT